MLLTIGNSKNITVQIGIYLKLSASDKKDRALEDRKAWEDYIKDPSDIYDKDKEIQKSRNGRFKFDLHGYNLEEANTKVREILYFV